MLSVAINPEAVMPINAAEMRLDGYCGVRGFSMLSTTNETELPGRRLPEANWTTNTLLFRLALADGISKNPTLKDFYICIFPKFHLLYLYVSFHICNTSKTLYLLVP